MAKQPINVRVDPEWLERVDEAADAAGLTRTDAIVVAVEAWLEGTGDATRRRRLKRARRLFRELGETLDAL